MLSLAVIVTLLGSGITTDAEVTADNESNRGYEAIQAHFAQPPVVNEVVVVRSEELTVDDPAFRSFVERTVNDERTAAAVAEATLYYETNDRSLVSQDRHALAVPLLLAGEPESSVEDVIAAVERADEDPRFAVTVTGEFTLDKDFTELSEKDLQEGELFFGLPAALIVLVLVFGAVVAGLVPVLLAIVSILVALALTALVGQAYELSFFVVNMISGMGLALGHRLLALRRLPLPRGAPARARQGRRDRRRRRHLQPRGALQRRRVRGGDDRHALRARLDPAQPGRRRDPRRRRLGGRRADAACRRC